MRAPGPEDSADDLVVKVLPRGILPVEASLLLTVRHPAIPSVREVGELPDGRAFVVREHVAGDALEHLPRDRDELVVAVREILEVLAYVHLRGVVHLDLKPSNLVRGLDGRLHLLDFGLAARTGELGSGGTPFFAAPELLVGARPDARADLFSLGAMITQALWQGSRVPIAAFMARFPAMDFWAALGVTSTAFPAPFDTFVERCVSRRPNRRFRDSQAAMEFLCGGSGRPSLGLLAPDPLELWRPEVEAVARVARGDVVVSGGAAADRRTVAMHLRCTVPGFRELRELDGEVRLVREGAGPTVCRLPPLDVARLAPQLAGSLLGLDADVQRAAAESLIAMGATDGPSVTHLLERLVEQGEIRPAGSRWVWPSAHAGRLRRSAPTSSRVDAATIRELAACGHAEAAFAAWRRGVVMAPDSELELRHALAEGLLDGGEPTRALPLCADAPVLRAQALLDLGQVTAAESQLAASAGDPEHPRQRRVNALLRHARGEADRAVEVIEPPRSPAEELTLAAMLDASGRVEERDRLIERLFAKLSPEHQPYALASVHTVAGHAARRRGDLEAAGGHFDRAGSLLFELGNVRHMAGARVNLGLIARDRGDPLVAIDRLREARALYEHVGDRAGMAIASANLGNTELARGDAVAARPWLETAVQELARLGMRDAGAQAEAMLARAEAALGDSTPAAERTSDARLSRAMPAGPGPSRELFRTFLAVNRNLAHERELDRAMRHLLDAAVTLTGGRQGFLLVERDDGVRREFQSGDAESAAQAFSRSLAHRAIERQRTLTGADALADRELQEMPSIRNLEIRSAICAPFCSAMGTTGAIYVEHAGRADAFGESDKEALEVLADQAAIAVDRMRREEALARELNQSRRELAVVRRVGRRPNAKLLGESAPVRALRAEIDKLAPLDLAVLISGETGTGKELVARALHDQSGRHRNPFVAENCSALPAELLERELFGHVQGAFTGADSDRPGLLELASGGTLFLDEVGDMPPPMQAKLLRALQEQSIRRVGGTTTIALDLRVVAATHKDLRAMVQSGQFREDLFFRLAAVELRVPPLRERGDDVVLLASHFLARHGQQAGRELRLGGVAEAAIRDYPWPGNVRELDHVMARAALLTPGTEVIDLALPRASSIAVATPGPAAASEPRAVETLKQVEKRAIVAAMQALGGDKTKVAKALGISRTALYEKLKRHGID
ncbi:MAG: sigma 54-interacting transcriptional regulator [Planctomycetes bacterium]|nr:sigma 54-interacting transcriptional regulator [Planctomycetota bacterium]